jgi:hypothetical protein
MQLGTINHGIGEDEGFIRLNTDDVRENLEDAIAAVVFDGTRILLQQGGEEVAALIPCREFVRLDYLLTDLIPSPFDPCEEDYYENDGPINCIRPDEFETKFELIINKVKQSGELFALLRATNGYFCSSSSSDTSG